MKRPKYMYRKKTQRPKVKGAARNKTPLVPYLFSLASPPPNHQKMLAPTSALLSAFL